MAHHPEHHDPAAQGEHHVGHVVSPKILIATALALLVLTVVTVTIAKIDFGQLGVQELNIFVALGIAVVKASLVCLFFMHLRWDRPFNAFVLVTSLSLVGLFISFAMTDTAEYKREMITGETPIVQAEVQKTLTTPQPPALEHPADTH